MSYRWVMKYLPEKFEDNVKSESATRPVTKNDSKCGVVSVELTEPPKEKILTIQKYANTHFVNVMVEKPFYTKLERIAEKLETTPDVIISNILLTLKRLEERMGSKNERRQNSA